MSKPMIEKRHIDRNIQFLHERAKRYIEEAAQYEEQGLESLAGWYRGRGEGFISAINYLTTDLEIFTEEVEA